MTDLYTYVYKLIDIIDNNVYSSDLLEHIKELLILLSSYLSTRKPINIIEYNYRFSSLFTRRYSRNELKYIIRFTLMDYNRYYFTIYNDFYAKRLYDLSRLYCI